MKTEYKFESPFKNCEIKIRKYNENICEFSIDDSVSDSFDLSQYLDIRLDENAYLIVDGTYNRKKKTITVKASVETETNSYKLDVPINQTDYNYITDCLDKNMNKPTSGKITLEI